jgi:hypothetical protein
MIAHFEGTCKLTHNKDIETKKQKLELHRARGFSVDARICNYT